MIYQMPLFDYYDIKVMFDRRLQHLRSMMRKMHAPVFGMDARQLVDKFSPCAEICPLELTIDEAKLGEADREHWQHSGTRVFELHIPYMGDDELWALDPGVAGPYPDGEFFRGQLILACASDSESKARKIMEKNLASILRIISLQNARIQNFMNSLPEFVHLYARRLELPDTILDFDARGGRI